MRQAAASILLFLGLFAAQPSADCTAADEGAGAQPDDRYAEAAMLVQQLGDEQFSLRERATTQLIELGLSATRALQEGRNHPDREIRYRCERILSIVDELDFQRRLAAFATGRSDGGDMPGWRRYRDAFGDDGETRSLFVEMQKAEAELLQAIENGPQGVARVAETRCLVLQQSQRGVGQPVSLGSTAALLFAAGDENVNLGIQATSVLYQFCSQTPMNDAMSDSSKRKILRKMLGDWIKRSEGWAAYQTLFLAMRYDLKEGLVPAVKILGNPGEQPYARQNAILAVSKLGDASHLELLESLLDDTARCSAQRVNNVTYETQIRDVALAALLLLKKQDPRSFGFERFQTNETTSFVTSTVGFENDDRRKKVFDKYATFKTGAGAKSD
jgi:hypothetical protein